MKKSESKKTSSSGKKSSLSSPLPPIRLPLCSYTSSPESPTPWWNRRVKHEKRYTMKCTFLCLHVYAWIEYIWYNMSKYLPRSRAPSSGRNGPSLHPRNPQAGSAAAKNCFGLDKLELVGSSNPNFFWNTHAYQLIWSKLHFLSKLLPGPKWQSWENP